MLKIIDYVKVIEEARKANHWTVMEACGEIGISYMTYRKLVDSAEEYSKGLRIKESYSPSVRMQRKYHLNQKPLKAISLFVEKYRPVESSSDLE